MTKVMYNGNEIELLDELEVGYRELDMLTDKTNIEENLEDTIELKKINLENTVEFNVKDLEDTQDLELGDINV